jgi:hypothetical protein
VPAAIDEFQVQSRVLPRDLANFVEDDRRQHRIIDRAQ